MYLLGNDPARRVTVLHSVTLINRLVRCASFSDKCTGWNLCMTKALKMLKKIKNLIYEPKLLLWKLVLITLRDIDNALPNKT